jgi:hypothetical protein
MEVTLMKKICVVTILILTLVASLPVQAKMKKLGQSGMTFLSIGGSARAAGMADVFSFAKQDLASVFYNPAGLATVKDRNFFFNWTNWIADMNVYHMAISCNLEKYGVFSLNGQFMDYGNFNGTAISNVDPRGYVDVDVDNVSGLALGASYAYQMTDKFAIGGTVKWVSQRLGFGPTYVADELEIANKLNEVGDFAFDFGTTYDTGFRSLAFHMSIRNYAVQMLYENEEFQLPQTYRIGVSADLFKLQPFVTTENHSAILAIEGVDPQDRSEFLNLALEYNFNNLLYLRTGWAAQRRLDGAGGFSAGAGFNMGSLRCGCDERLDIAYSDFGSVLGSVVRISLTGTF